MSYQDPHRLFIVPYQQQTGSGQFDEWTFPITELRYCITATYRRSKAIKVLQSDLWPAKCFENTMEAKRRNCMLPC